MYLHILFFQQMKQAQEASQIQITCTNITVGQGKDGQHMISFLTLHPIGPVTAMLLKQETQATTVMVNEPQAGTPPRYSVSLAQMLLTVIAAVFFIGLVLLQSAGIAGAVSGGTATGVIAYCSNDIISIMRSLTGTETREGEA